MTDMTLSLVLIVKGRRFAAARAAAARGIPMVFIREARGETIGQVSDDFRDKVMDWYGETTKAPFTDGDLLHFSEA
jgi:hypothetical protein